jgi:hypothetical protein
MLSKMPYLLEAQAAIDAHFASGGERGLIKTVVNDSYKKMIIMDAISRHGSDNSAHTLIVEPTETKTIRMEWEEFINSDQYLAATTCKYTFEDI